MSYQHFMMTFFCQKNERKYKKKQFKRDLKTYLIIKFPEIKHDNLLSN